MITLIKKSVSTIPQICKILLAGEVIAAPTETAYGLLADATNKKAVTKVFKIKNRQANKPSALIASDIEMVKCYFKLEGLEKFLAVKIWPAPLTLLLKPKFKFPQSIIGLGGLVGVRVPANKWLRNLVASYGRPLTATSANPAGRATVYSAAAVKKQLSNCGLKFLIDGGYLSARPTSTVVKINHGSLIILRSGAISEFKLWRVLNLNRK